MHVKYTLVAFTFIEEELRRNSGTGAAIGFTYYDSETSMAVSEEKRGQEELGDEDDEDDTPYQAIPELKAPVGIALVGNPLIFNESIMNENLFGHTMLLKL